MFCCVVNNCDKNNDDYDDSNNNNNTATSNIYHDISHVSPCHVTYHMSRQLPHVTPATSCHATYHMSRHMSRHIPHVTPHVTPHTSCHTANGTIKYHTISHNSCNPIIPENMTYQKHNIPKTQHTKNTTYQIQSTKLEPEQLLSGYVSACTSACPPACLPVDLSVCLSVCVSVDEFGPAVVCCISGFYTLQ